MHIRPACFLLLLFLPACGSTEPETLDANVTFTVIEGLPTGERPVISREAVTFLAVEKTGRTPLVDAWQEDAAADAQYGRHRFPRGTSDRAMAAYYAGLLRNAGWEAEKDFDVDEQSATLRFHGVRRVKVGADSDEISVAVKRTPPPGQ